MASLTIYLDEETLKAVEAAAKKHGSSVSSWARHHLNEAAKPVKGWPDEYFERIESFCESTIEEPEEVEVPLDTIDFNSTD